MAKRQKQGTSGTSLEQIQRIGNLTEIGERALCFVPFFSSCVFTRAFTWSSHNILSSNDAIMLITSITNPRGHLTSQ
jgi:hypothetical protein